MNSIVAVDENFGIGYEGRLLTRIPEDMKFFRRMTLNKVVVMGHNTFKSLPNAGALEGRTNIILTSRKDVSYPGALICNSIGDFGNMAKSYNTDDIFIIGGQAIYELFLPYCKYVYLTKIFKAFKADRFFPDIDRMNDWKCVRENGEIWGADIKARQYTYENMNIKDILDYGKSVI